jgi:hypothetical protein
VSDALSPNPEVFLPHTIARTDEYGRHLAVQRYLAGQTVRDIAGQLGISRTTVYKWIGRSHAEGWHGLSGQSSRPHRSPQAHAVGRRAAELAVPNASARWTGAAVCGAGASGLDDRRGAAPLAGPAPDRSRPDQRRAVPQPPHRGALSAQPAGDLLHVDVKELGRIPNGGGWRLDGASTADYRRSRHKKSSYVSSTSPSTTTAASPTPRSTPTRRPPLPVSTRRIVTHWFHQQHHDLRSVPAPHGAARSTGAATTGQRSAKPCRSAAGSSSPAAPGLTAKTDASTAPCSPTGPAPAVDLQQPAHRRLGTPCSTATTLGDDTPPPADNPDHQTHRITPVNIASGQDSQSARWIRPEESSTPTCDRPLLGGGIRKRLGCRRLLAGCRHAARSPVDVLSARGGDDVIVTHSRVADGGTSRWRCAPSRDDGDGTWGGLGRSWAAPNGTARWRPLCGERRPLRPPGLTE